MFDLIKRLLQNVIKEGVSEWGCDTSWYCHQKLMLFSVREIRIKLAL